MQRKPTTLHPGTGTVRCSACGETRAVTVAIRSGDGDILMPEERATVEEWRAVNESIRMAASTHAALRDLLPILDRLAPKEQR